MARREALLQEVAHTVVIPVTSFSIPRTSLVRAIYDYDVVEERDSLECGEHRVPLYFLAEIETERESILMALFILRYKRAKNHRFFFFCVPDECFNRDN